MPKFIAYIRRHSVVVAADAVWFLIALAPCIISEGIMPVGFASVSVNPAVVAIWILAMTVFWMPIRNVTTIIRLADRRRREELSLTFIEPRDHLWHSLKWPMLRLSLMALCLSIPMVILSVSLEDDADKWLIPIYVFGIGGLAHLGSAAFFLLLFRWFCRSPRDHWMAPAASILVVLGTFVYLVLAMCLFRMIGPMLPIDETISMFIGGLLFTYWLARRNWRACWTKYFVFE